jgi:hypothetical protein
MLAQLWVVLEHEHETALALEQAARGLATLPV